MDNSSDLTTIPIKHPLQTFEKISFEIDFNTGKDCPADQESVRSLATDEDSQPSLFIRVQEDKSSKLLEAGSNYPTIPTPSEQNSGSVNLGPKQVAIKPTFNCDVCGKVFPKHSRLLSHMIVHSDEKDFICSVCGKGFKNGSQLQRHSNTHSAVPNFCCNICGRGFKHNDVAKHMRRWHSGPRKSRKRLPNPNVLNDSSFNAQQQVVQSSQILSHSVQHPCELSLLQQNQPPLQSVIIQNQPANQEIIHLQSEQQTQLLSIGMCQMDTFSGSSNDSVPMCQTSSNFTKERALQFHCSQCTLSFLSPSELASHMALHPQNKKGRKEHQCHLCQKTFTRASGLTAHILLHTRTERRRKPNPNLRCSLCGKLFTRPAGLKAHMLQHEGVPRFWCDEANCGRGFVHSYQLIRHKRFHSDILPFTCDVCGRSFRHNDLAKHMRIHTGAKPYNCQHCGKAFAFNSSLRTHERMHLALKEHLCEICNMGFSTTAGLRRHSKIHEDEREELCGSCGKLFPSKLHLSLHMHESLICSQQSEQHLQQQSTQVQSSEQVHLSDTEHLQVLPLSQVPHLQVQQVTQMSIHKVPNCHDIQNLSSVTANVPNGVDHQPDVATLTNMSAGNSEPVSIEQATHTANSNLEPLPVLVPFSVSVPISVPFGINLNSSPPDQIQLNQFLSWEQKY